MHTDTNLVSLRDKATPHLSTPFFPLSRLCLQYTEGGASAAASSTHYNGMMDALIKTYKYEGVRGLYKVSIYLVCAACVTYFDYFW